MTMKQARLIFVNITKIVWGFTEGAGAKTVKYSSVKDPESQCIKKRQENSFP